MALAIALGGLLSVASYGWNAAYGAVASGGVELKLSEFKFAPPRVEVKAGKTTFKLVNTGVVEHNIVFPKLGKGTGAIKPGQTGSIEVTLPAGTHQAVCDIPGHKEAGMVMTVVAK
jgi:nitrite reductase (NO-forming)